jgi:hypothetical protein
MIVFGAEALSPFFGGRGIFLALELECERRRCYSRSTDRPNMERNFFRARRSAAREECELGCAPL